MKKQHLAAWPTLAALVLALLSSIHAGAAPAATWTGANGDIWRYPWNWNTFDVPDQPGEWALLPERAQPYSVQIACVNGDCSWPTLDSIRIELGVRLTPWPGVIVVSDLGVRLIGMIEAIGTIAGNMTIEPTGEVQVPSHLGSVFALRGPRVLNHGRIVVNHGQNSSAIPSTMTIGASTELASPGGQGVLLMRRYPSTAGARLVTASGAVLTQRAGHTLRGAGQIEADVVNEGLLAADVPSHPLYYLDGVLDNRGVVEAGTGSHFRFAVPPANLSNGILTGGTWRVLAGGRLELVGLDVVANAAEIVLDGADARFTGGTLPGGALAKLASNQAGGTLAARHGAVLPGLTPFANSGAVAIDAGSSWTLSGTGISSRPADRSRSTAAWWTLRATSSCKAASCAATARSPPTW